MSLGTIGGELEADEFEELWAAKLGASLPADPELPAIVGLLWFTARIVNLGTMCGSFPSALELSSDEFLMCNLGMICICSVLGSSGFVTDLIVSLGMLLT